MAAARRLVALSGDTLDLLLFRDASLGPADLTRVYEANPGLADLGPILPLGTVVAVPAAPDPAATGGALRLRPLIQLWD